MTQVIVLALLLILAVVVLAVSVVYHVSEVRAEAAAWDALIARTRRGGGA